MKEIRLFVWDQNRKMYTKTIYKCIKLSQVKFLDRNLMQEGWKARTKEKLVRLKSIKSVTHVSLCQFGCLAPRLVPVSLQQAVLYSQTSHK